MSDGPDRLPFTLDERAVGLVVERDLADAGDDQRVDQAEEHGEDHHRDERGNELASHHFTPRAVTTMSMSLMPMNGAITPPAP